MGQKTNPIGLRIAVNKDWGSKWYAEKKEFGKLLAEDRKIREILKSKLEGASVSKIQLERAASRCRITIFTARPGVVIGRKGARVVAKTLKSARANAEDLKTHKEAYAGMNIENLHVKLAVAGTAGIQRRFTPKARGSAGPILKRNCHVKIVLSDE